MHPPNPLSDYLETYIPKAETWEMGTTGVWIPAPFPPSSSLLSRQGQALRGNDGGSGADSEGV